MAENSSIFLPINVQEFDRGKVIQQWNEAFAQGSLLSALRIYWRDFVPMVCKPALATESKNDETRDRKIQKYLFGPLEQFLCGGDPSTIFTELKNQDKPQQICGHVFKSGEPTYSCRECGMDPTCVLCIHCFENSVHRNHRYRMSTSGGGGYCDCGDVEAWKSEPFCEMHKVKLDDSDDVDVISTLPEHIRVRAEAIFCGLLRHTLELLVWEADDKLPEGMHVEELNDEFTTMLFNDEVHTYEQVISTLKRAVHCSQKEAVEFATAVDREGRACVHIGKYSECDKAKAIIEKSTSRLGSKPLKVQVLHSSVVSQQMFAVKILQWLQTIITKSDGLRELFCRVSMEPQPPNHVSLLEEILRMDTSLWKAARVICHQTIMAAILLSPEYKKKFAILFTVLYPIISSDYIKDDHDHSVCVVSESVQLFTVPSLARMLIKDYDLLKVILSSFLLVCDTKKKQNGKFAFDRSDRNQSFRRAQYMLHDLKYALTVAPEPHEWNEDLRKNFIAGFKCLLQLLSRMQGMDAVTRQTGQHIEFEPEWEGAFNLQLRLDDTLTLFLQWCQTDREVLLMTYSATADAVFACRDPKHKLHAVKLAGHEAQVVKFDVSSQPISIHLPLSRLLAGLHLSLAKFNLSFLVPEMKIKSEFGVVDLFEHALRVQVMIAQTHAGMWRRNGFSLLNQIYFYSNVKCRREMYDRDIVLLQAGGSLMNPDDFMIHLVNKFGLLSLMKDDYDKPSPSSEDLVRQVVIRAEEMLNLLIILVSERFHPDIGNIESDDALKREIVHQLCIQPMAHSELNKALPDDPKEDSDLDRIIHQVATCKEVGGSGKKMFELKPEFLSLYNPYFYHYHRSDQTKSEEEQRKRKKAAGEDQALPPPTPPKFKPAFEALIDLLSCDVMIYVMKLVLRRSSAPMSRSWSEAQLERVLHLIGIALHEDRRYGKEKDFPFLRNSTEPDGVFNLLEGLVGHENVAHGSQRDLLTWVLGQFHQVMKLKDASLSPSTTSLDSSANDEKAARDREKRAKLAEKRRKQLLEQMAKMQKNFIQENAELFESTDSDLQKESDMDVVQPYVFPVCVGPERNEAKQSTSARSTCILCQEQQDITLSGRAMVLATYSQKSTVLSKRRGQCPDSSSDPLFMYKDLLCGIFTSTCGHVMHADCWQRFFDSVVSQERRRMFRFRHYPSFDIEKMEFLCPLCETISNSVMPIIPPLLPVKNDSSLDLSSWLEALQQTVEASLKTASDNKEDEDYVLEPCPLALVQHMLGDEIGEKFTKLYESKSSTSECDSFSESIGQMVRKMARDVYSVNVMTQPDEENDRVPIFVWQTCAYSIQALERGLTDEGKPLFGALSSRQNDCLSTLVKMASVVGQVTRPRQVKGHCIRLLNTFLLNQPPSLLDLDVFHGLVSLSASLPLLFADPEKTVSNVSSAGLSDLYLIQLSLIARIVQIMEHTRNQDVAMETKDVAMETDEFQDCYDDFYRTYHTVKMSQNQAENMIGQQQLKETINEDILPFLRCVALFYHFLTDINPPDELFGHSKEQLSILCRYLGLPQDITSLFTTKITYLVKKWVRNPDDDSYQRLSEEFGPKSPSLVTLPEDYSQLINKLCKFTCPNSDGDDSRAPTMCLVCGALLCSQSYCCQMDLNGQMVGAATYHAHHCGAGIGLFLRVRECQVLLLASRTKGCFLPAPYLDKYGETDQMLRRGNPLFLSADRYKKLQKLWLSHGIPEEIAHQLESNTNLMTYEWHNL